MGWKDWIIDCVGLGLTAGVSCTAFYFFKSGKEIIRILSEVTETEVGSKLVTKVTDSNGEGVVLCIHGSVKALDEPLKSLAREDVYGVSWRHTVREHLVSQIMGIWMTDERIIDTSTNSVPFVISNHGIGIQIDNPSELDAIDLAVVSEKFDPANYSLADHLLGWVKGIRSTGMQQTEEMLVDGTRVMGVGRVILKEDSLHLVRAASMPYIVTTRNKEILLQDLSGPLPVLKILTILTACGALYYTYRLISRIWRKWLKAAQLRAELRSIEEARTRREAQDLPESFMCVICCGLRDVVLQPCQHVCVCGECSLKLEPRHCPVCRTPIETIQPVFYS